MAHGKLAHALVRQPSPSYGAYYAQRGIAIVDTELASQHSRYSAALGRAGLKVDALPPHPTHHDCIFIEDTAIVWENRALITRMNDVRQGEQVDVEAWLKSHGFEIEHVPAGARIEGGDVLHFDDVTLVGLSARTNDTGIEALRRFMAPFGHNVRAVPVTRCLHLKSAMTYLGDQTVLTSPKLIDVEIFPPYRVISVDDAEPEAGNVLRINSFLLFPAGFPRTAERIRQFGAEHRLTPVELDISEARKGDGALTCQSILW